jgi:hypothetical protein
MVEAAPNKSEAQVVEALDAATPQSRSSRRSRIARGQPASDDGHGKIGTFLPEVEDPRPFIEAMRIQAS